MAGGKRKGAGRPSKEATKVIRVPVGVLDRVNSIIDLYKRQKESTEERTVITSSESAIQTIQKNRIKSSSYYPVLTSWELKRLRLWLFEEGFTKSKASARKMTSSPIKCKQSFLKYSALYFQFNNSLPASMSLVASRYVAGDLA